MKNSLKYNKGITLIALVITIIVLIILAGVAINLTLGDNGIFKKAKYAKEEYTGAAINEEAAINAIDIDNLTSENPTKDDISSIDEMLKNCGINEKYTEQEILSNKDNVLDTIFENDSASDYLIKNFLEDICNSKEAMSALGDSNIAYEKIMSDETFFYKITQSPNIKDFEKNAKKIPKLSSNTDKGFTLSATEHINYNAYNAFDENGGTYWITPSYGAATLYIQFPENAKVYHISYFIGDIYRGNYTPTLYEVYGVNGQTEELITSGNLGTYQKEIYFYNNTNYSKYKIYLTAGVQAAGASILNIYYR